MIYILKRFVEYPIKSKIKKQFKFKFIDFTFLRYPALIIKLSERFWTGKKIPMIINQNHGTYTLCLIENDCIIFDFISG